MLVAIDWGTSSLRGVRMDARGAVQDTRRAPRGILTVPEDGYPALFQELFGDWMRPGVRALICGMAGSRQGWREAAYVDCPSGADALAGAIAWIEPGRIGIVPGLACVHDGVPDVMRGEETQVFGALDLLGIADATIVLPGTHSKWVRVRAGRVEGFATCMTGEVFALLRSQSILGRMMHGGDHWDEPAFRRGLDQAAQVGSLLATAFSARSLALFDVLRPEALASYLSGLVIGEELRSQGIAREVPLVLVGDAALCERYRVALGHVGVTPTVLGEEATWRGLWNVATQLETT